MSKQPHHKKRVLVAPLDWGLGHTTRCIPIIKSLIANQYEVFIAGNLTQQALLKIEFPDCTYLDLVGYNIKYATHKKYFLLRMVLQIPRILLRIRKEHLWLKAVVKKYNISAVISDNRFGLYHSSVKTIFVTHQLQIKAGKKWMERWMQAVNYKMMNRFSGCWIPDIGPAPGLAGTLSHPRKMPDIECHYIHPLSRFEQINGVQKKYALTILLSGPEPQRSILENKIIGQLKEFNGEGVLVRGLPAEKSVIKVEQFTVFNHLPGEQLNRLIQQSEYVICRSGYSTIMDLYRLGAKSILIPTPGQTEQEYLAETLCQSGFAPSIAQDNLHIMRALQLAKKYVYTNHGELCTESLDTVVKQL